jgi:WD40 repeat protein
VGSSQVLIGAHDHSLGLFDLAALRFVNRTVLKFWPRSARVSPAADRAALLHHKIAFSRLPDLAIEAEKMFSYWNKGVARCAAFSPDGSELAIGKTDGLVFFVPVRERGAERPVVGHKGRVLWLESLEKRNLLVSLAADGELLFTPWKQSLQQSELPGKIQLPDAQVTSLHVSKDGAFMALGNSESGLSLWDLRVLDVPALIESPLASGVLDHLAGLQALLAPAPSLQSDEGQVHLPPPVYRAIAFMECILRYRFRFDVEIGEAQTIQAGEYDIEIDG